MNEQALAALLYAGAAVEKWKEVKMSLALSPESTALLETAYQSQSAAKESQAQLDAAQTALDEANKSVNEARTANNEAAAKARTDAQAAIASISGELGLSMPPAAQASQGARPGQQQAGRRG